MRRELTNRREFLVRAGVVVAGVAATPSVFANKSAAAAAITADPGAGKKTIRGLMVDAARVPEPAAYYKRVIEFCSDWELNTLQFRLTDDQGSAMRFTSVPDLVTHNHAFTAEELKSLWNMARATASN